MKVLTEYDKRDAVRRRRYGKPVPSRGAFSGCLLYDPPPASMPTPREDDNPGGHFAYEIMDAALRRKFGLPVPERGAFSGYPLTSSSPAALRAMPRPPPEPPPRPPLPEHLSDLDESLQLTFGDYTCVSKMETDPLIRAVNLAELSLPAMGQKKVDIMHLLPRPIYDLLSPENFHNLIDSSKIPDIAGVPVFDHFESPSEKFKVYRALNQREMLEFVLYSGPDDVFWGVNGMFCLLKPDGTLRLLCDNRRGNSPLISMARFQALYAERVKGDSRYPAKLLDLVNASRFSDMPPGAMLKTESDLSDFFHMLLLPPHMRIINTRSLASFVRAT